MRLYLSHSGNFDYQTELYEPLKQSSIVVDHSIFFPHDPENIDTKTKDIIPTYDVVIAEVSYPSTGQGIEIGWASASDTPVFCFYRSDSKPSGALRFVYESLIEYSTPKDLITQIETYLATKSSN